MPKATLLSLFVAALMACGGPQPTDVGIVHDPCSPLVVVAAPEATATQLDALADALAQWNAHGLTRLSLTDTGAGDRIGLSFAPAAGIFFGLYEPSTGDMVVNESVTDRGELAVVIAHELGHAMGLPHVEASVRASVMNKGNLELSPTPADGDALSATWNGCR